MRTTSGHFLGKPNTKLGWWAVGLSILFVLMFASTTTSFFHFPGRFVIGFGFIAGIITLISLLWKGERSWLVWLMLLPGLFAIIFALGEILFPH